MGKKHKKPTTRLSRRKWLTMLLIALMAVAGIFAYQMYKKIYGANVDLQGREHTYLHIPSGSGVEDVYKRIKAQGLVKNYKSFEWLATKKNYPSHVYPGKYKITDGMSNNALIEKLRSGNQEPVDLTFNNIRSIPQLAGVVSHQIEADSARLIKLLHDQTFLEQFDMTPQTAPALFIPNTYEFWWNTNAQSFIKRMYREHKNFWKGEKSNKAQKMGMNPIEVTTLASIVDEETLHDDEMADIAGVYINRLERGMRLQADPTIKYTIGDFSINRVLKKHLETDSPYNTYKYTGLPPGPISIPSISAIRAVLNHTNHDYLYFAARPDFSGYHNFSKTHRQHIINARKYQRALNQRRIME